MQSPLKNRPLRRSVIATLVALALLVPAWWWAGLRYQERLVAEKRLQVTETLTFQARILGAEINDRLAILKTLKMFVDEHIRTKQAITPAEFAAFGTGLGSIANGLRAFSIAPNGITQFIFPAQTSERTKNRPEIRNGAGRKCPRPRCMVTNAVFGWRGAERPPAPASGGRRLAGQAGLEPATLGFGDRCSTT